MTHDRVTTSKLRRSTALGRLAAGETVKQFGTRAANMTRSGQASEDAMTRRQVETAKQIVTVLGGLKGAAMKVGQMLSFIDVGLVGEEHRDEFQRELAKLRDSAPSVPFKQMRSVIEAEMDGSVDDVFAAFDQEPIAAASIGQVYRAVVRADGREVAVKVQYPGIAAAVRGDMQSFSMILRPLKRLLPEADLSGLVAEIGERFAEELDYELEAENQRSLARIYRGHPFIMVPDVVTSLCSERVLVTEFADGVGFEQLKTYEHSKRDRIGEIMFRFFLGSLYRHGQFSGDPHPGNVLLLDDGRVAFLDFGLFKRMDHASVALELDVQRAVAECDAQGLQDVLRRADFLAEPNDIDMDAWMSGLRSALWWYTNADEVVEVTPDIPSRVLAEALGPRSAFFKEIRRQGVIPGHLFARRMEMLTLAGLSQLGSRANWHRIAREWMYGDEPVTQLGREDAAFYADG